MALTVDIAANTRQAQSQVKDLSKALDATADALDDVAKDGSKAGDKVEASFRDIVRASERAADDTSDAWKKSYRKSADAADDFERDASGNVGAFKDEALANFSEVASSFDGSLDSMADGVQGLTGGLASSLTPGIGIPIAILGAAAGAFLQSWITASEDSEVRVEEMFGRLDEFGHAYISRANIANALGALSQEDVAEGIQRATDLQLDQNQVLLATVGDTQAIAGLYAEIAERKRAEVDAIKEAGGSQEEQLAKIDAANVKYGEQPDWLRQIQKDTTTAGAAWDAVQEAVRVANGEVSTLASGIRGLPNPNVTVKIDDRAYQEWWAKVQQRALDGITVNARPGQGRFLE